MPSSLPDSIASPWKSEKSFEPLLVSLALHGAIAALVALAIFLTTRPSAPEIVELEVVEYPKEAPAAAPAPPRAVELNKAPPPKPRAQPRAVFGVAKSALTATGDAGLAVKAGNTIAKEEDDKKLRAGDAEALPIPADEIMVSRMPRLRNEVRVPYPPEAKKAGVQGAVIMDLLIDDQGRVREAKLLEGPGYGLNEAALAAVQQFTFEAAEMQGRKVAVRIRYAYRFVLER